MIVGANLHKNIFSTIVHTYIWNPYYNCTDIIPLILLAPYQWSFPQLGVPNHPWTNSLALAISERSRCGPEKEIDGRTHHIFLQQHLKVRFWFKLQIPVVTWCPLGG